MTQSLEKYVDSYQRELRWKKIMLFNNNINYCISNVIKYLLYRKKKKIDIDDFDNLFNPLGFMNYFENSYEYDMITKKCRKGIHILNKYFDDKKIKGFHPVKIYHYYYGMITEYIKEEDYKLEYRSRYNRIKSSEYQFILYIITRQIHKEYGISNKISTNYFLKRKNAKKNAIKDDYYQRTQKSLYEDKLLNIIKVLEKRGLIDTNRRLGRKNEYSYGKNNIWLDAELLLLNHEKERIK